MSLGWRARCHFFPPQKIVAFIIYNSCCVAAIATMAPSDRKARSAKKATIATMASSTRKAPSAKKVPSIIALLGQVDTKTIAVLGNNRAIHQTQRHEFSLAKIVPELLKDYPGCGVWISRGSPLPAHDPQDPSIPTLNLMVVPGKKSPPPYVAYSVKDELKIIPFSQQGLSWSMVAPRVHILKSNRRLTQRSIQNIMTVDERAAEEHAQLFTLIPNAQWHEKANGEIDVPIINFAVPAQGGGEPTYGSITMWEGLSHLTDTRIDQMVESFRLGEDIGGEDPAATLKTIIEDCLVAARAVVGNKKLLEADGYDTTLLDQIKTIKLYPKGTAGHLTNGHINKYYLTTHQLEIA
jgi:hypothetical protein